MRIGIFYNYVEQLDRGFERDKIADNEILITVQHVQAALQNQHEVIPIRISQATLPFIGQFHLDFVFNLCEGIEGNVEGEALIPAILDLLHIPYTGSDHFCLALSLNKLRTKQFLLANRILTPPFQIFNSDQDPLESQLNFPSFVKPVHEDASIGIDINSLVTTESLLRDRVRYVITNYHQPALVEEYIDGREINVALLGNAPDLEVLPLSEITFDLEPGIPHIVDYESKWVEDSYMYRHTAGVCPASLDPSQTQMLMEIAIQAYKLTGCRDYARVDFRLRGNDAFVLEVNPNPGINIDSGFFRCARTHGMTYEQMIHRILMQAMQRYGISSVIPSDLSLFPSMKTSPPVFYRSDRLDFCPIQLNHISFLHRWFQDPYTAQYMADPGEQQTIDQLIMQFLALEPPFCPPSDQNSGISLNSTGLYCVVILRSNQLPIGYASIYNITHWNRSGEISYLIGESRFYHQGFGSEIIRGLTRIATDLLHLHRIEATVTLANIASWKALEHVGFRKVGTRSGSHFVNGTYLDEALYEFLCS